MGPREYKGSLKVEGAGRRRESGKKCDSEASSKWYDGRTWHTTAGFELEETGSKPRDSEQPSEAGESNKTDSPPEPPEMNAALPTP